MSREVRVAAAQMGPVARADSRDDVVERLIELLRAASADGAQLVAFPELALTTFFPRWWFDDQSEIDAFFEEEMPGPATKPLFDEARRLGVGFSLGFAERAEQPRRRYNSTVLIDAEGVEVARYRKIHLPGHEHHEPWRPFQHLERGYFDPGPDPFAVHDAFGARIGLATCNDRRWPETFRVLGLQEAELVLIGYNTPIHYAPDPDQDRLAGFHNNLVMAAGAYQNGMFVVGVAKGGLEEGVESLADSQIIAPSGEVLARAATTGDEVVIATCDLDWCERYRRTVFDFARYRRPEMYELITRSDTDPREAAMTAIDQSVTTFSLNGEPAVVRAAHPHLLAALRDELDVTSPKDGCAPSGQCGCCTVLLGGKAVVSCQVSLERAEGKEVVTLEGFDDDERTRFADAFAACGALQCGFCTPGILVRAKALIDKKGSALTRDDAARHLGANLCRCTGYVKILDAVEQLAQGTPVALPASGGIGAGSTKYEATPLSLGERDFIDDMTLPGMLHGVLVLSAHARAEILAIDTAEALAAPGVEAVFTAADIPGELRVGIIHTDWPVMIPVGGRTSYLGDVLAIVVADSRQAARDAAELVRTSYDVLRTLTDPVAAIDDPEIAVWGTDSNVLSVSTYQRGDAAAAWEASPHRLHEVFQTQRIEHAFLEPESTLAVPRPDGGLHVYSGGQGVWDDRNQIASVLGLTTDQVSVELVSNGGAFGGKEDMSNQAQTSLAAWKLQRPVKCTLTREQSLLMHPKRHPIRLEYRAACDADGHLTAIEARMIGDSGSYASVGMKVLERAAGHAGGPYRIPAIDVEAIAVRTNNPACGAFRGFGANQAQFAMEGVIDRLAEMVGISGWEMRVRNVIHPGDTWGPGQIMDDGCQGAAICLDRIAPAYEQARAAGKAVGLGLGLKNSGLGNGFLEIAKAVVRFREDGMIEVRHCWTEMGQGVHSVARQVAVSELGVDPERVVVLVDTSRELGAGQTTGSRGTVMGAGSVAEACHAALADGCQVGIDYEGEYRVDWTNKISDGLEHPVIHSAFGYAAQLVIADRETGAIEKVVAVHDVGKAVNPLLCTGQIEGAVHMGLGYALTEDFPADDQGRPLNMTLKSLGIIRPKDMPEVEVVLVEHPQPRSPYGIKGVGEIGLVPTAGAVAAMLHEVEGTWRSTLPMRPDGT